MKHSILLKLLAFFLAVCALTVSLGSALGIAILANEDLYSGDYESWKDEFIERWLDGLAMAVTESFAVRSFSDFTSEELLLLGWGNNWQMIGRWYDLEPEDWAYTIARAGSVRETTYTTAIEGADSYSFQFHVTYPRRAAQQGVWDEKYQFGAEGAEQYLYVRYDTSPEYHVTLWLRPDAIGSHNGISLGVLKLLMDWRYYLIAIFAAALLVLALCLFYLFCAAGKKHSKDLSHPQGLNKLPLDLYALAVAGLCTLAGMLASQLVEEFVFHDGSVNWGWFTLGVTVVLLGVTGIVGFLVALAAQVKVPNAYAWRHSCIGFLLGKLWQGIRFVFRLLCKLYKLLPLVWRYLLTAAAMAVVPMLCGLLWLANHGLGRGFWGFFLLLSLLGDGLLVCYGAYAFGTMLRGVGVMADGDLHSKVDTRWLRGSYLTCAQNLNTLADVAQEEAKNRMRSERMKTELITNVSHDIKTPLTSIINYVDLLQQAQTDQARAEYLEVLDRQSQKLKKLIEDLMEMSKATTGDMAVDIGKLDAVEAVKQALGEFSDKLDARRLQVVLNCPAQSVQILADGRLTWRVMSNLLGNVVKYAMAGTRVYVDVTQEEGAARISIKNISAEPLNISADELTERFVRGDSARNTEGSGLGLNIAKSLMELQKGSLTPFVDGDLFKITLLFPKA